MSHAVNLGLADEALPLAQRFLPHAGGAVVVVENDVKVAAELFAAADPGDAHAALIRDQLVAGLARAVRALVHICDIESVVLTGGVVAATPALQVDLAAYLYKDEQVSGFESMAAVSNRLRWLPASYPAGAIGAALLGGLADPGLI